MDSSPSVSLFGVRVAPVDYGGAVRAVLDEVPRRRGGFFCLGNVHTMMVCRADRGFREAVNSSIATFPDGMGLAWALKALGHGFDDRVRGTDLMLRLCKVSRERGLKVFLYGNTEETLTLLREKLSSLYPGIRIEGAISPPFRDLAPEEDEAVVSAINGADPDILFVSLGAPRQELWMRAHMGRIRAVQLGVGAAFDFITGKVREAPRWMQRSGLEWLHRLPQQFRKTLSRMLLAPGFVVLVFAEVLRRRLLRATS